MRPRFDAVVAITDEVCRAHLDEGYARLAREAAAALAWLVVIDGVPVDVRQLPRPLQEQLAEAGFIPYVPGER